MFLRRMFVKPLQPSSLGKGRFKTQPIFFTLDVAGEDSHVSPSSRVDVASILQFVPLISMVAEV